VTEDEKLIYETRMALHENLKRQNEHLIKTLKFYADPGSWTVCGTSKGIAREDRGELARKTMRQIWGMEHDRKSATV